jgi:hypothetical protein
VTVRGRYTTLPAGVVHRMFVATPTEVAEVKLTAAMSEAMDLIDAAGMSSDRCAPLLLAAEQSGKDIVAFARHLVTLGNAVGRRR